MGDYLIPASSPLDALVRTTSSRRRPNDIQISLPQGASDEHALYPDPPKLSHQRIVSGEEQSQIECNNTTY